MLFATILTTAAFSSAVGASPRATGFLTKLLRQGDQSYPYVVYVPASYDGKSPMPVLVFLHGAGECGSDGTKHVAQGIGTAILWHNEQWPFIVIMPQKPDIRDPWEKHDAAVMAMLAQTRKEYKTDRSRTYLTGLSQGGHGTWVIGGNHPDVWAAIAPICGYGDPSAIAPPLKGMAIWCFHGEADDVVKIEQSKALTEAATAAGAEVKFTTYPGVGHNSWDKAYREEKLAAWLLEHRRPDGRR